LQSELAHDGWQHRPWVLDWRQRHIDDPVSKRMRRCFRNAEREAGFPYTAGPREREEPDGVLQEAAEAAGHIGLPADQRRQWFRQTTRGAKLENVQRWLGVRHRP